MPSTFDILKSAIRQGGSLALLLSLAGCGLNGSIAHQTDPFIDSENEAAMAAVETLTAKVPNSRKAASRAKVSDIQQLAYAEPNLEEGGTAQQRPATQAPVQTAQASARPRVPAMAIERMAGGPRELLERPTCPAPDCRPSACPPEQCPPGASRTCQPGLPCPECDGLGDDEYLCDGGDRNHPIHYEAGHVAGFDTEDAMVEYTDSAGDLVVTPTNKVCLYAPRFGAVTAISELNENHTRDSLYASKLAIQGGNVVNRLVVSDHQKVDRLSRVDVRKRGSELFNPQLRNELHGSMGPVTHDQSLIAYNDFTYVRLGILIREEEARLKLGIQGAANFTRKQNPVIAGHLNSAAKIEATFRGAEITGREPPSEPGVLKICKLADRREAQPGDIVTFTIRYDNLGDLSVSNVVISDNLTPRMEYIPDSATCDRKGRLLTEDNGEGSLILRWELEEPVPGHQGGTISFKAKVR